MAIVRLTHVANMVRIAEALQGGGIQCMEVTMNTPGALQGIESVCKEVAGVCMGAGTVLDAETAREAISAGAEFLVTPTVVRSVIEAGHQHDVAVIVGAMTPTEILTAWQLGADFVKVFPAHILGAGYISAVRGPLPQIPLAPTGGITAANAGEFITKGASVVCAGGWLVSTSAVADDGYAHITDRACMLVEAVRKGRAEVVK